MQVVNINESYFLKQNDTASEIRFKILGYDELPYDLTDKRVEIVIGNTVGRVLVKEAVLLEGSGEISFGLDDGDFLPYGKQRLEVHIYDEVGERVVAPSKGYYQLRVEQTIDSLGDNVTAYTFDFFMDELQRISTVIDSAKNVALDTSERMDNTLVGLLQATVNADTATDASKAQTTLAKTATTNAVTETNKVIATNELATQKLNAFETDKTLALSAVASATANANQVAIATDQERVAIKQQQTAYETTMNGKITNVEQVAATSAADSKAARETAVLADGKSTNAVNVANEAKAVITSADARSASANLAANTASASASSAVQTSLTANSKSDEAKTIAQQANVKSDDAIRRADNIIASAGNSNTEIVDGRLRSDGSVAPTIGEHIRSIGSHLADTSRQTTTLASGVSVVNAEANAPANVEVEGRTLVNVGNTNLVEGAKYVLADPKTRLIVDKKTVQGVAKFVKGTNKLTTATFEGKVSGSTTANPHKAFSGVNNSLWSPSSFTQEHGYSDISLLDGKLFVRNSALSGFGSGYISQQLFSFNIIEEVERNLGKIPKTTVADKVAWLKANINFANNSGAIKMNWHGWGSSTGGSKATVTYWNGTSWAGAKSHTDSKVAVIDRSLGTSGGDFIDSNGFVHFLAHAEPSDSIIPSVINTDFISLDVELNANTDLITRPTITRVANFEGKVGGSVVSNPHIAKQNTASSEIVLLRPDGAWTAEASDFIYNRFFSLDTVTASYSITKEGVMAQQLFSFNLIEEVERNVGRIPRTTVADKVTWLKANVEWMYVNWHGFGSSVGGNKANVSTWAGANWQLNGDRYATHTKGTVSLLRPRVANSVMGAIQSDGFAHFLAYAEPSDGVTPSVINTDYIDLEIELKPDADFTHPRVPLYEVTDESYNKILVDWDANEVVRRYPSVEGVQHLQGVGVFAEGDNLLDVTDEAWEVGSITSGSDVGSALRLRSKGFIQVVGGQQYTMSLSSNYAVSGLVFYDSNKNFHSNGGSTLTVVPSGAKYLRLILRRSDSAAIELKEIQAIQPMLTLGNVAKPFVPRNPSYVFADVKLGAIADKKDILYEQDGRWLLRKSVEKDAVLDGSLGWSHYDNRADLKRIAINHPSGMTFNSSVLALKNNGSRIVSEASSSIPDRHIITSTQYIISVSNSDTGFADAFTPSTSDWKRYFNGWKYSDGVTWTSVTSNGQTATAQVALDTKPTDYTPYKLSYVLATPQIIDVTDKVEGALKVNGLTQVGVLSGVVRREKVVPVTSEASTKYYLNNNNKLGISGLTIHNLNNRTDRIFSIRKNGQVDKQWVIIANSNAHGKEYAELTKAHFDPTAEYTVTYVALDKHLLTANPTNVKLTYAKNIRGAVNDMNDRTQDNSTMLSIHEKAIIELYVRVKALEVR